MIDLSCQLSISELVQASSKCQSEAKCEAIDMKVSFYSHANKTRLHKKGFAPSLVLKVSFGNLEMTYCSASNSINRCCTHSLGGCFLSSLQSHLPKMPSLNFTDCVPDQHEHSTCIYSDARHNECRPLTSSEGSISAALSVWGFIS